MTVLAVLGPDGPVRRDPEQPVLRADDLGVLRGESVFETMRIANGRPAFVDAHLQRLHRSAARLAMDLPAGIERLFDAHGVSEGVLRIVCTKGGTAYALVSDIPAETLRGREQGVRAITLTLGVPAGLRAQAPWLLGGVKATSYAVNMATLRHAHDEGVDDAIWLSTDGEVLEAPTATVAWVKDGVLVTPPAGEVAVLPGTTVAVALGLLTTPYEVRRGTADELRAADEVLMLSSVRGIAPVVELDGRGLGTGPVTAALRDAFEAELLR
ncbi:MAG: aminotransferase class IV [Actinobacteria bacterium]|nr:aminotransferase class IV [Actinomycetota bacterium]MCA1720261.1 aminotransferase class IV [Actinomycetota bacterium]